MKIANEVEISSTILTVFPPFRNALVIAPHPDDEVFGCGGTISILKKQGGQVLVVVATNGSLGGNNEDPRLIESRSRESCAAAGVLGLDLPSFWGLPDRGLEYGEVLIERVRQAVVGADADLLFLPSPTDWHPDHQSIAFAGAEAIRRLGGNRHVVFYEVTDPLPSPNLVFDISSVNDDKLQAMRCFQSQLQEQPYDERISGINRFRAFHLGARVTSAEAFTLLSATDLAKSFPALIDGPLACRRMFGFAATGSDMPLVSVIIRSMDRPTLVDALDSLALQTYSNIEVVLVNAKGAQHQSVDRYLGRFPVSVINSDGHRIPRSRAANLGLDAAQGEFLMFLDDDDWVEVDHIEKLVAALKQHPGFEVAYTGVKCVDENKNLLPQKFDFPFDVVRMLFGNFIPIHAVMFDQRILAHGCRLDEALDLYEDWDFWVQLSKYGDFLYVEGLSAIYRITQQTGFGVNASQGEIDLARSVLRKWFSQLGDNQVSGLIEAFGQRQNKDSQILDLHQAVAEHVDQLSVLRRVVGERDQKISTLDQVVAESNRQIASLNQAISERDRQFVNLTSSTSWQVTKPFRLLSRLLRNERPLVAGGLRARLIHHGKRIYWRLPVRCRAPLLHWGYRNLSPLFRGMPHYEQWKSTGTRACALPVNGDSMLLIDTLPPALQADGSIAIHLHMYYHDLADEFSQYLKNMPFEYDLYVSVSSNEAIGFCREAFSGLAKQGLLVIEQVPNRGRDIAPMFCTFGSRLRRYDYVAHLHSKKSLYNHGATEGWRQYLCGSLFGNEHRIRRIFSLMQGESPRGIVYPQNYRLLPYQANTWLANKAAGVAWCARLGIAPVPNGYFDFPVGSMFWAKSSAIKPLFDAGISIDDFSEESGQTDGTFAHCLERLLGLSSRKQGYRPGIIMDVQHPTWSVWGFQQYSARPFERIVDQLTNPAIKLIAFDIFDTLLCRPLLDAESIKLIVAERSDANAGQLYLQYRAIAESQARESAGRDVGMDEIFAQLGELARLPNETLAQLKSIEVDVEKTIVSARSEVVELYRRALATGKPVALISDMFLPRAVIEECLQNNGISGWNMLFLSNEIGLRKDGGGLYEHVFRHYGITAADMLMVGDNERADYQIPFDMGVVVIHLLRPVEFARGGGRFRALIESNEGLVDINRELTLGLVVLQNFSAVSYPQLDPDSLLPTPTPFNVGYSLIGPLLVGFSQWLVDIALSDEIDHFYFLSREGQLIKQVYDIWNEGMEERPQADYLIVSRRAVSVSAIKNIEDICNIAKDRYFPNTIRNFLYERYGLELPTERWNQLTEQMQWRINSTVEVNHQQIGHLLPLLEELESEILAEAKLERGAMTHYLSAMGVVETGRHAVVDIGYGGTIQNYLNQLVPTPVHGYYLVTDERAVRVAKEHEVLIRGCYLENIKQDSSAPMMYQHSFELEKLLSSSDAQIVRYELDQENNLIAHHRELSKDETECVSFRTELQEGVTRYARDAKDLRDRILPGYKPSCELAKQLYEAFITQLSPQENNLLKQVVLDDHYCGRGVV